MAFEVARELGAPLDVLLVRKLGFPGQEELAMGAVASGGVRVLNEEVVQPYGISSATIDAVTRREQEELVRREALYRGNRTPLDVAGRTVVVVDDGLATGSTMKAALKALRAMNPRRLIMAVPVAPASTCREVEQGVDETVCLMTPEPFIAVGLWYERFGQTSDEEVRELLLRSAGRGEGEPAPAF